MATSTQADEEIIDFLAAGTSPQTLSAFQPSETAQARVAELIARQKTTGISAEETSELNRSLQLEHLMRLAKARAQLYLAP